MAKQAISLTLEAENVTWLKGRAGATGARSVSELLDQLVTAARESGSAGPAKSVVGTIDIDADDPRLLEADKAIAAMFTASLRRPMMVKEAPATYGGARKSAKRRG
jgi:carbamate kinase